MKIEENLVNNDEIDLIFSPSHIIIGSNKENKIHSETNLKKYCLIIFIIFLFGFSIYIENKGYNITYFIKNIKKNIGIEDKIDDLCEKYDPINLFELRLNNPITVCDNRISNQSHLCYLNTFNDYFYYKNGVFCTMKNIIINTSKASQTNIIYNGSLNNRNNGFPILDKGFFNMYCDIKNMNKEYSNLYSMYFKSWNYDFIENEKLSELAPGKTIFFMSRNQDSPNLFHGHSELINALALMELFHLKPENIKIIFLDGIIIKDDPIYDLYKNIISRGGEPIYIRDLKHSYFISSAINVPTYRDSSVFLKQEFPNCENYQGRAYKLLNDIINKYMNISKYKDSFISDNEIYYYPKSIIDYYNSKIEFKKYITIQWRRIWPKGRIGQSRLLGNGPELAEKLANSLPKYFLVRLVDTARLSIKEQISLMRNTDYLVGIHGAGLTLSIYMPIKSILHEVLPKKNMGVLTLMSSLSGHRTYSDILRSKILHIDGSEYVFFNKDHFVRKVLLHMRENGFFEG